MFNKITYQYKKNSLKGFLKKVSSYLKSILKIDENKFPKPILIDNRTFYSQSGQDYFVYNTIYQQKKGYFIDVGALDGIESSNTYKLEQMGWSGICIEPNPDMYDNLLNNRNCIIDNSAISEKKKVLDFIKHIDTPAYSGFYDTNKNNNLLKYREHEIIKIKTVTLNEIIKKYKSPKFIDYIDIDVEGHEYECIKSIDFLNFKFGLIGIEIKPEDGDRFNKIEKYLHKYGYVPLIVIGPDTFFHKPDSEKSSSNIF
jgi:FkbM family methyltransferase